MPAWAFNEGQTITDNVRILRHQSSVVAVTRRPGQLTTSTSPQSTTVKLGSAGTNPRLQEPGLDIQGKTLQILPIPRERQHNGIRSLIVGG